MEVFEGISFLLFLKSAFLLRFKADHIKKMCGYPQFSFTWNLNEDILKCSSLSSADEIRSLPIILLSSPMLLDLP